MDYSKTVNLPKTAFAQRARLAEREPERLARWAAMDLYGRSLERRQNAPRYLFHDGPPYSNGHIHMGTALNKVLKDIVTRYRDLTGYHVAFTPGWDNHGLPIEHAVLSELSKERGAPASVRDFDPLLVRRACRDYAARWVDVQREEFQRLGVRADWDHPYLTMRSAFEAGIVRVFAELAKQGYVYRGERATQWSPTLRTALAEAEIEYEDRVDPSIFVAFPVVEDPRGRFDEADGAPPHVVVWTTTPWTIPANLAIALHPELDYRVVQADGRAYLVADYLADSLAEKLGWTDAHALSKAPGAAFEGVVTRHPLYNRPSPIVFADYVTLDEGTGCVHTAPGHGKEDFDTGRRYGLPIYCPVDEAGVYTAEVGERLAGRPVLAANDEVCAMLSEADALLKCEPYPHSYPHDARAKEPIIFRATTQWFLNIDHDRGDATHRQAALREIERVHWVPPEGETRITAMVAGRPDWCLSRQRYWGVGIPAFYTADGRPVLDAEVLDHVVSVIAERGADAWFDLPPADLLPEGWRDPDTGAGPETLRKETDVLDVWFDSGSTPQLVYGPEQRGELVFLEGSDQHRGWFNATLMVGVGTEGRSPYREVITHGYVLDAQGRKMSKSLGNVISPLDVMAQSGADVLRLWVASSDYFQDINVGDEILGRVSDRYRDLRNAFRFWLGNLHDFDPAGDAVGPEAMSALDRYVLHLFEALKGRVQAAYDSYVFHRLVSDVHQFCLSVSALYLDAAKDELYCGLPWGPERRAIQTVLYTLCDELARLMAPVLAFTCDEVWEHLPGERAESVHLTDWPAPAPERLDEALAADWTRLLALRDAVKLAQERFNEGKAKAERVKPLEMAVTLTAAPDDAALCRKYMTDELGGELRTLLVVSRVEVVEGEPGQEPAVALHRAEGRRCERSWRVFPADQFGNVPGFETLSDRDARVVQALREAG